jgi:hypothetical protein
MNLGLLQANRGDMVSTLALSDFYENVKDPSYKIDYPPSKKILESFGLLDCYGNVHQVIREAFKAHDGSI